MRNRIYTLFLALALSMGAFFMPLTAYAGEAADTAAPVVKAGLQDGKISIEATDEGTGIRAVYINGKEISYSMGSGREVMLTDYAGAQDSLVRVYAVDRAGNMSGTVEINNPLYEGNARISASASAGREQAESETAVEGHPFTPEGQAAVLDNATQEEGKEFYTFETADGSIFYLVVDKQRDSDNVYFLNSVTENDLLPLAEAGGGNVGESAVVETQEKPACGCADKCRIGRLDTSCAACLTDMDACMGREEVAEEGEIEGQQAQPEPEQDNGTSFLFILIGACIVGGAGYYLKIYKPRHDLDDAEDLDDLLSGEDEEINEDLEPEDGQYRTEQQERDEPDMADYDDYPYGEEGEDE